ncbi:hypothetical protein BDR03DRAFT_999519 [Suillus americanus]|nr:hypothetical protein BDR03DRAFT_999519 [Suillus americanus]
MIVLLPPTRTLIISQSEVVAELSQVTQQVHPARQNAHCPLQDADPSENPPVPTGWTTKLINPDTVQNMLHYSTGLTATLELAETNGSRYVFSSSKNYYLWNTASQDGWHILNVKSRNELYTQLAKGKGGLKLEELPDYGSDLEG